MPGAAGSQAPSEGAMPTPVSTKRPPLPPEGGSGKPSDSRSCRTPRRAPLTTEAACGRTCRKNAKQPTTRLCSADESVMSPCRCQQCDIRSFHGLCFPFKAPSCSAPGSSHAKLDKSRNAEALRDPGRPPQRGEPRASCAAGSLERFSPSRPAEARLLVQCRGPKPSPSAAPFQRAVRTPVPCAEPSSA